MAISVYNYVSGIIVFPSDSIEICRKIKSGNIGCSNIFLLSPSKVI